MDNFLMEKLIFMFYLISSSNAAEFCSVSQWFSVSTVGLIITICSNYSSDINQTQFDLMKNTSFGYSFEIDLTNIEIPNYSIQLDAIDGCFGDESLIFDFTNEKCPSVDSIYYTVYCELTRFRYNLSNPSQVEKQTIPVSNLELCDRFGSYYYYNDIEPELMRIRMKTEDTLNQIDHKYSFVKKISVGVSYLSVIIISVFVLRVILSDTRILFEALHKRIIERRLKQRQSIRNNEAPKEQKNSKIYNKIRKMNDSIFNHSYFQNRRNQVNQA